jgi:hypothetical protein
VTAHRIWIFRGPQLEDEIWADSERCQDAIGGKIEVESVGCGCN